MTKGVKSYPKQSERKSIFATNIQKIMEHIKTQGKKWKRSDQKVEKRNYYN